MEDDTTKKPVVPVVPVVPTTSAPIADEVLSVVEPVKEEVVETVVADETPATDIPVVNDEKVAEPTTADVMTAEKVESDAVNEIVPVEAVAEALTGESVTPEVVADAVPSVPVVTAAPVKATSEEEESLIDGIVNTLVFDDADDGKKFLVPF